MNADRLLSLAISDTGFIFDPVTGTSFNTNTIGIEIINYLKNKKEIPEIIDLLFEEYEVSKNELESDIIDFIQGMQNNYLI